MKKKNKNNELREIPRKNYYVVLFVSILVVIITLYVRSFYLNYQMNSADGSIFHDKSINQINIDDLDYAVDETNETILFVSYNNDPQIERMERRLYREIEKKNLNDRILYLDVTNSLNNDEYIKVLRSKFPNVEIDINKAPMFIYIKDGNAIEAMDSEYELVDYKVLNTLLSKYGIE